MNILFPILSASQVIKYWPKFKGSCFATASLPARTPRSPSGRRSRRTPLPHRRSPPGMRPRLRHPRPARGRPGAAGGARRLREGGGPVPAPGLPRGPAAPPGLGGAAAGPGGGCGGVPAPPAPPAGRRQREAPARGGGGADPPAPTQSPPLPRGFPWRGKSPRSFVPACPRVCGCPERRRGRLGPGAPAVRAAVPSPSPKAPLDAAGRGAGPAPAGNAGSRSPPSRSAGARAAGGGSPSAERGAPESCPRRGTAADLSPVSPARGTGRPQPRVPVPSPREQRAAARCGLLRFIQALVMPG